MESWAPLDLACDWDNVGLQIGDREKSVSRVLVSLDVDAQALAYLDTHEVDLVITHHPLFFKPISKVDLQTDIGQITARFLKKDMALYSAHTNLDAAEDGVTDALIRTFGLDPEAAVCCEGGIAKWLKLKNPLDLESFKGARLAGQVHASALSKVAFCGGSGKSFIPELIRLGIDTFVTGEVGYHDEVSAKLNGLMLVLLGHKASETCILPKIKERILAKYPQLDIVICD